MFGALLLVLCWCVVRQIVKAISIHGAGALFLARQAEDRPSNRPLFLLRNEARKVLVFGAN